MEIQEYFSDFESTGTMDSVFGYKVKREDISKLVYNQQTNKYYDDVEFINIKNKDYDYDFDESNESNGSNNEIDNGSHNNAKLYYFDYGTYWQYSFKIGGYDVVIYEPLRSEDGVITICKGVCGEMVPSDTIINFCNYINELYKCGRINNNKLSSYFVGTSD